MKLSDVVIKFLEDKGINTAFTVSGGGCIHLIDSLRKSNLSTFCVHHEQSALMASEGYFRMNNKMSANIVTTGPRGTNTITNCVISRSKKNIRSYNNVSMIMMSS